MEKRSAGAFQKLEHPIWQTYQFLKGLPISRGKNTLAEYASISLHTLNQVFKYYETSLWGLATECNNMPLVALPCTGSSHPLDTGYQTCILSNVIEIFVWRKVIKIQKWGPCGSLKIQMALVQFFWS
jgi:hypothetical protein